MRTRRHSAPGRDRAVSPPLSGVQAYSGFEPRVGEIRALRTFRIGPGGILYPLFGDRAWTPGPNTACCRLPPPTGQDPTGRAAHRAPDPDCGCGFYAYAADAGAAEYPQSRHVLAVIACWGRVIAGTRGLRSQHARIEALWMSPTVPADLQAAVVAQYPDLSVYDSRTVMLAEHAPTLLAGYEIRTPHERSVRRRLWHVTMLALLVIGSLPAGWIWHQHDARVIWAAELLFFLCAAGWFRLVGDDRRTRGSTLLLVALTLWLIAPFAGGAGILLLRLPILQIALVGWLHRARSNREASRFPASVTPA